MKITESAVKWYLFDTRRKMKEDIISMKETNFVYRPRELHMAISGEPAPVLDILFIENSLIKQNIYIPCYQKPKTLTELAEMLGVPKAYLKNDLRWLEAIEFVIETKLGYSTCFLLQSR